MLASFFWIIILLYVTFRFFRQILEYFQLQNLNKLPVLITGCDSGFGYNLAIKCIRNKIPVFGACLTQKVIFFLKFKQISHKLKILQKYNL